MMREHSHSKGAVEKAEQKVKTCEAALADITKKADAALKDKEASEEVARKYTEECLPGVAVPIAVLFYACRRLPAHMRLLACSHVFTDAWAPP